MLNTYSSLLIKWRYLVVLFMLLVAFAFVSGGQYLSFNHDYRVFFDGDNPQLIAYNKIQKSFTKNDNVLIALTPNDGQVFTKDALAAIEDLTERAWQIPYSVRVDSISNFQNSYTDDEDTLIIESLVESAKSLSNEQIQKIKEIVIKEPELVNRLVSADGNVTAINITIELPGNDIEKEIPEIASHTRELVTYAETTYPNITFHTSGVVMMNNAFAEASQSDMETLVPLTLISILVIVFLFVGGLFSVLSVFLVVILTILTSMGVIGWAGVALTSPLMSLIPIVITLAVADCVHLLTTWNQELRKGKDKHAAIIESIRVNFMPVFFTSVTTAIGFLALNFSDVPPFRDLGNFSAFGVLAAFVYSITLFPALIVILPRKVKSGDTEGIVSRIMDKLATFVLANQKVILLVGPVVAITLSVFIVNNKITDNFIEYYNEKMEFRVDTEYVSKNLGGVYFSEYSLDSGSVGGVASPKFLRQVEMFSQWLEEQPEVVHVNSIVDMMKRLNQNMHGNDKSEYKLPEDKDLTSQYFLLYEMSLPYGLDLSNQVDLSKTSARVTVTLKVMPNIEVLDFEERVSEWMKINTPAIATYGGSPTIMFSHIAITNLKNMSIGTVFGLVVISLLLILIFKSVGYGLLSLIPNLAPMAVAFGFWGVMVSEVGMSLSFVMAVAMGIIVDDTIHFMSKYLRGIRELKLNAEEAVRYAFSSCGVALWVTSIALIVGFLILGGSAFKLNSDMGIMTSMIIALALIMDFLLLPPLLVFMSKKLKLAH